jgi:hypothetical protein
MQRKLLLRLDRSSLTGPDLHSIQTCTSIAIVDAEESCFQYRFESISLDHALLLLGTNKSRFGFDLRHYIRSAHGFFAETDLGFVVMPDSTPDFKRRFSEDLGVAIGSLLLVDSIALRWETICQIPTNKKLDKSAKTPDFVGFDTGNKKRVYECKGTTDPSSVDKSRQKAKDQLSEHSESGVTKFAMVTYVPTSAQLIPPFLFVSDPPIPLPLITERLAVGLHFLLMLQFAGIEDLIEPVRKHLELEYRKIAAGAELRELSWTDHAALQQSRRTLPSTFGEGLERIEPIDFQTAQFVGKWHEIELDNKSKVRAFTGISLLYFREYQRFLVDLKEPAGLPAVDMNLSLQTENERQLASLLPDGSLLLLELLQAPE